MIRHDVSGWVLAGSFALEVHRVQMGLEVRLRPHPLRALHDIDFVVDSFDRIPETLGADFLFRHVHPFDPPAKTLLQSIDLENALRVDVFRTLGPVIERSIPCMLGEIEIRVLSFEDILARLTRLSWDIVEGVPAGRKYVRGLIANVTFGDSAKLDEAWQDHRKPEMPPTFRDAMAEVARAAESHPELLITPVYSTDPGLACDRCHPSVRFPLCDPGTMLAVLGYC